MHKRSQNKTFRRRCTRGNINTSKPLPLNVDLNWLSSELRKSTPLNTGGADDFKWSYLHCSILSKLPMPEYSNEYRSKAAIDKMLETEEVCREFNIHGFPNGFSYSAERLNTVIFGARRIISDVLGSLDYSLFEFSKFSGGASTSRNRRKSEPYYKYSRDRGTLDVTLGAYRYAKSIIECTPMWHEQGVKLRLVSGNRVTTVPKKTEIDRTIAMEPDMNMYLQQAVGRHIRRRLRFAGIDLNDQTVNQRLAKQGSICGQLSTIDLSSASDSISYRLVEELLPFDWFSLLDDLRSPTGELPDGSSITWEKFSSMGNGFTFELESLLFYALVKSTIEYELKCLNKKVFLRSHPLASTISVYGDDIICHSMFAPSVISVLKDAGFATNVDKTFMTGPFRESCGKHYFDGIDVTPFYVKSPINGTQRIVWLLNSLRKWSMLGDTLICDPSTYHLWRQLRRRFCPRRLLGGKDIDSTDAVVSPGPRRDKLVPISRPRSINGIPAILRWFQITNGADVIQFSDISNVRLLDEAEDRTSIQLVRDPCSFHFRRNEQPWRPIPLYSQEIV